MASDCTAGCSQKNHSKIVPTDEGREEDNDYRQEMVIEQGAVIQEMNSVRVEVSVEDSGRDLLYPDPVVSQQPQQIISTSKNRRKQPVPAKWVASDAENDEDSCKSPQNYEKMVGEDDVRETIRSNLHLSQEVDIIAREHDYSRRRALSSNLTPRKSEVEKLFSSLNNLEMTALLLRNRPRLSRSVSQARKGNSLANRVTHKVGETMSGVELSPRTRSQFTNQSRQVPQSGSSTLRRSQRLKKYEVPVRSNKSTPTRLQKRVSPRTKKPKVLVYKEKEVPCHKPTLRKRVVQPPVVDVEVASVSANEASCRSMVTPVCNESLRSSHSSSGSSTSRGRRQRGGTRSTRTLPCVDMFKSTFSFDEVFFKDRGNTELDDLSSLPKGHFLRKWKINRCLPTKV
jgi:hypothetical protein